MFRIKYLCLSILLSTLLGMGNLLGQRSSFLEDYSQSRQWTTHNFAPVLQGAPNNGVLNTMGDVTLANGQANFNTAGGKGDKRVLRKLGTPLGLSWTIDLDFTPIAGSVDGVGHAILAVTAGTEQPYREVTPTVTSTNPFYGNSITDQDAILIEYGNNAGDAYSDWFLRIGCKDGTNINYGGKMKPGNNGFALGDVQYLRLELNGQVITLSLFSDAVRSQLVQQRTYTIGSSSAVPTGLHVIQHSNKPQLAFDRWLTASMDNLRIYDASLPCIRCEDHALQLANENRVVSTTVRVPVQDQTSVDQLSNGGDKWVSVAYFDGFGRPLEEIAVQAGTDCGSDIVRYHQYDHLGKEKIVNLPFLHQGPAGSLREDAPGVLPDLMKDNFYQNAYPHYGIDLNYLSAEIIFENSPIHRVREQGAPGLDWQVHPGTHGSQSSTEHTVITEYLVNDTPVMALHPFQPKGNPLYTYAPGELKITRITNEHGHISEVGTNKIGQTIYQKVEADNGQFAYTLYDYDEYGRLTYVLSPEGVKMAENGNPISNNHFDHFGYNYVYDSRNRIKRKWMPNNNQTGHIHTIYNERDEIVLTQDANQRAKSPQEWTFTKYDVLGRPIMTGIYTDVQNRNLNQMTNAVKAHPDLFEVPANGVHGYSNQAFPILGPDAVAHSVTYYDSYDFDRDGQVGDPAYQPDLIDFPDNVPTARNIGRVTGVKVAILDKDADMPDWLWTVSFYDKYGRELQTQADNHLGGTDIATYSYNYTGEMLFSKQVHQGYDAQTGSGQQFERSVTISNAYQYDHRGRLIREEQKTEDQGSEAEFVSISEHRLDPFGQEIQTGILFKDGTSFLQEVDYQYNIRGWLTSINELTNSVSTGPNGDLFAMKLSYQDLPTNAAYTPQYNGNISMLEWQVFDGTAVPNIQRYDFAYDEMDRLTEARYEEEALSGIVNADRYTVTNLSYTLGGNILTLDRYGKIGQNTYGLMDQLSYLYEMSSSGAPNGNSNRLAKVTDAAVGTAIQDVEQFVDGADLNNEYSYDGHGNLTSDANKGIALIEYNYLDKPTRVVFDDNRTLMYIYSADGSKLRQKVFGTTAGNLITKTTDYLGGIQYEDSDGSSSNASNKMVFFAHSQGRVRIEGTDVIYEGFLTDHLGNTRVVFADVDEDHSIDPNPVNGEVLQVNHYYPFGLKMASDQTFVSPQANQYLLTGKEYQDELGLGWTDFGARMYDASIGRWNGRDVLAEKFISWSPYNYVFANPINVIDPDGRDAAPLINRIWTNAPNGYSHYVAPWASEDEEENSEGSASSEGSDSGTEPDVLDMTGDTYIFELARVMGRLDSPPILKNPGLYPSKGFEFGVSKAEKDFLNSVEPRKVLKSVALRAISIFVITFSNGKQEIEFYPSLPLENPVGMDFHLNLNPSIEKETGEIALTGLAIMSDVFFPFNGNFMISKTIGGGINVNSQELANFWGYTGNVSYSKIAIGGSFSSDGIELAGNTPLIIPLQREGISYRLIMWPEKIYNHPRSQMIFRRLIERKLNEDKD